MGNSDVPSVPSRRGRRWSQAWMAGTTLLSGLCLLIWSGSVADRLRSDGSLPDILLTGLLIIGYGSLVIARGWWFWHRGRDRPGRRRLTSLLYWAASLPIGAGAAVSIVYCGC